MEWWWYGVPPWACLYEVKGAEGSPLYLLIACWLCSFGFLICRIVKLSSWTPKMWISWYLATTCLFTFCVVTQILNFLIYMYMSPHNHYNILSKMFLNVMWILSRSEAHYAQSEFFFLVLKYPMDHECSGSTRLIILQWMFQQSIVSHIIIGDTIVTALFLIGYFWETRGLLLH